MANTVKEYSQMIGWLTRDKTTDVPGSMAHGLRTGLYDGGRVGFNKAGLAHPNRKTLTAKEKKLIDAYEKRTGLKYIDQSSTQQWKIRTNPNAGRNQAIDAGEFSEEVKARIKKYQKEYDEGNATRKADIRSGKFTGSQLGFKKIDDPERLQAIKDYVKKFEKEKGVLPTKNEIRKHFKKTTGSDPGKSVTFLVERGELKDLPTGYGMQSSSIVDNDVKKLLKNKNIIDTLDSGKFPTISQIKNILKVDPTVAEVRAIDLGQTLTGNRDIRFYKAPTKYKKLSQDYLDKNVGDMFKAKGAKSRAYYEKGLTKLLNLPKSINRIREDIVGKITNIVPELKGIINVDEVASLTASMRRGSGPYAIFGQVLGSDFNQHVKGLGIDKAKGLLEKRLTTDFLKGDPQRLIEQKNYNEKVKKFEADANKNNPAKKVKGLKLSFEPPSKTIKNKKIYNQYKDLFDAHYEKTGYSFEVSADRDSIVDISKKLDNPGFQNTIKNRFKKLIGKGGKVGALAGMGTLAASGFALADDALAADGTEAKSILPEAAAGTGAALGLGTKTGRKLLGKGLNLATGPTGMFALTKAFEPEGGYDLRRTGDRIGFEAEAALAPTLVKGVTDVSSKIKNPLLRKGIETLAGVRIPGLINPANVLRAARVASPIGIASLAGEGLYALGKKGYEQRKLMETMTEEEKRDFLADQYEDLGGVFGEGA